MTPAPQRRPSAGGIQTYAWALALGALLGWAVHGMAGLRPGDTYTALMAVVMVGDAAAAFVFAMLGLRPVRPRAPAVRGWLAAIGAGLLVVLGGPLP